MPEVILNGPEGRIECMYSQGKENGCPVALILHPEPYQGGSMNNKVTYSLYQEFQLYYYIRQFIYYFYIKFRIIYGEKKLNFWQDF